MYCVLLTIISLFITKERALTKAVHSMEKLQGFFSTEFTILFRVKIHQVWFSICSGFNAVQLALNSIIIFLNTLFLPFKTNVNRPVPILIRFEISVYLYRKYLTKGSTVQNFFMYAETSFRAGSVQHGTYMAYRTADRSNRQRFACLCQTEPGLRSDRF